MFLLAIQELGFLSLCINLMNFTDPGGGAWESVWGRGVCAPPALLLWLNPNFTNAFKDYSDQLQTDQEKRHSRLARPLIYSSYLSKTQALKRDKRLWEREWKCFKFWLFNSDSLGGNPSFQLNSSDPLHPVNICYQLKTKYLLLAWFCSWGASWCGVWQLPWRKTQ